VHYDEHATQPNPASRSHQFNEVTNATILELVTRLLTKVE